MANELEALVVEKIGGLNQSGMGGQIAGGSVRIFFTVSDWITQQALNLLQDFPLNPQAFGALVTLLLLYYVIKVAGFINNKFIKWAVIILLVWLLTGFLTNK